MFGVSGLELFLIVVFLLVIFGPDKLPDLARTFGKAMRSFKTAQAEMEKLIRVEMYEADRKDAGLSPIAGTGAGAAPVPDEPEAEAQPSTSAPSPAAAIWAATEDDEEEDEV